MLERTISSKINTFSKELPVLAIVGPRQSGKSTLCKMLFPTYKYLSLENMDLRSEAMEDPRSFLNSHGDHIVIDEIQRVPTLLSYMQEIVDNKSQKDYPQFVITGSQQFIFLEKVTQTLAGRINFFYLYPLTLQEIAQAHFDKDSPCFDSINDKKYNFSIYEQILKGGYPRLYDEQITPNRWAANYITTYLERDIRQIINITDLRQFEIFLKLVASNSGQLLNFSNLSNSSGVSQPTIKKWISLLETSGIIFTLSPHYRNFNKRLVKSCKIYFVDTLILCYLLGIRDIQQLKSSPLFGNIFESFIISELWKRYHHIAQIPPLYFWRDKTGNEIDLLIDTGNQLFPIEIKSGTTMSPSFKKNITKWFSFKNNSQTRGLVIYRGETSHFSSSPIPIVPWDFL